MIQAVYHKTGLTIDEVHEKALISGEFEVKIRSDDKVHVMLYPKRFPNAKIQILTDSANVWCDLEQLSMIEDLLNKNFRNKSKRKPFKRPEIHLLPGECRNILETPLGLLSTFVYYYGYEIAESVNYVIQTMDIWDKPFQRKGV